MLISETSVLKQEIFRLKVENDNLKKANALSINKEKDLLKQMSFFKEELPRLKKEVSYLQKIVDMSNCKFFVKKYINIKILNLVIIFIFHFNSIQ